MNTSNTTTSTTILTQLGGRKFLSMTGASCYADSDGQTLVVTFKGLRKANIMYVTLNANDTYDVKICKWKAMGIKTVKEVNGAYADMLVTIFEKTTGLRTSL